MGVRAALEEKHGQVEVAVHDGHQKGAHILSGAGLLDVCPCIQKSNGDVAVPLPGRVEQGREAAVVAHAAVAQNMFRSKLD